MPPGAPEWVINSTPVSLSAGASGQVPYPTQSSAQLGYVLAVNSSPFAVIITQGGRVLGQVPAFTAQVFPLAITGQPIGYSALAPAGIIVPGQDTTLYLTWSDAAPYGQWPASIGSSAVPFAANLVGSFQVRLPLPITTPIFSTLGYGAGVFTLEGVVGIQTGGPYQVDIQWYADAAGGTPLGGRTIYVGSSGGGLGTTTRGMAVAFPHEGDYCQVTVSGTAGTGGATLTIENRTSPQLWWAVPFGSSGPGLLGPTSVAVGAGLTVTTPRSSFAYEGPAQLLVGWGFNAAAFGDWRVLLTTEDETGTRIRIGDWQATAGIQSAVNATIVVPPGILALDLVNGSGAAHTAFYALIPDLSRAAA